MRVAVGTIAACRARMAYLSADIGFGTPEGEAARCVGMRLRPAGARAATGAAEAAGAARMVDAADEAGMLPLLAYVQSQAAPQDSALGTDMAVRLATYAEARLAVLERRRSRGDRGAGGMRRSRGRGADAAPRG